MIRIVASVVYCRSHILTGTIVFNFRLDGYLVEIHVGMIAWKEVKGET